jgi:NAD(P)H-flavin reductase
MPIQAIVADIIDPHPDIRIIRIHVDGPPVTWLAGQFMELSFQGVLPRSYSIASAPHEQFLEFHIRNNNRGGASQHAVTGLKTGDHLTLRGPFGTATLRHGTAPVVMIAGGMGISPIKALVDDILRQQPTRHIALYWGTRTTQDLYIRSHFEDLAAQNPHFRFIPVVEDQGDGMVDAAALASESSFDHKILYLSGPPAMITAALKTGLQYGALPQNICGDDSQIMTLHKGISPP